MLPTIHSHYVPQKIGRVILQERENGIEPLVMVVISSVQWLDSVDREKETCYNIGQNDATKYYIACDSGSD